MATSNPYSSAAHLYDGFNKARNKDYSAEANILTGHINRLAPDASTLLDCACGSGQHLKWLASKFEVSGIDLNQRMLDQASEQLPPDIELHVGDLLDFDLDRKFDVITCLFSSIAYVRPFNQMQAAVANMARHLNPGGVLAIEPWLTPDTWDDDFGLLSEEFSADDQHSMRMSNSYRNGTSSGFDMHYLEGSPDKVIYHFERHQMELYTVEQYSEAVTAAGLSVEHDQQGLTGRGLILGKLP